MKKILFTFLALVLLAAGCNTIQQTTPTTTNIQTNPSQNTIPEPSQNNNSDPNGYTDIVVTGITVYPDHPIVNSKDVKITYTIKNIGTKTSNKAVSLLVNLIGFTKETPVSGGNLKPLKPGESWSYDFTPYTSNDFFKIADTPGTKTVQIILNPNKEVVESNYDNNTFTQEVQMYPN